MNINEASNLLHSKIGKERWFTTVGIGIDDGKPVIYLYVKFKPLLYQLEFLDKDYWCGYRVIIAKMGQPRAC